MRRPGRPALCLFTETYYPVMGGGETQARALAEALAARGYGITVLTCRSSAALHPIEQIGGVTVRRLPPGGRAHGNRWGLLLTGLLALIRLRRHYDLIFVSGFRVVGLAAIIAARLLGKGCILKADSLGEMSGEFFEPGLAKRRLGFARPLLRLFVAGRNRLLRCADAFVAISSPVAAELAAAGVPAAAVRRIPNSVDTSLFRPADAARKLALRHQLDLCPEDLVAVYSGRLVSYKGLPLLLRVWRDVQRRAPHARLLLVGEGGLDIHNCEADLQAYVRAHGLQSGIRFTGRVANVSSYLQAADLFVFPSENEAFGLALVEAMACGLPVIATSAGGLADIVEDGCNGLVIEPGNASQLAAALATLFGAPDLRADLGRAARQRAEECYTAERVTQQYVELFEEVLSHHAA